MQSISFALVLTAALCSSAAADSCPNPNDSRCAGPPTDLSATVNSPTQITLTWTAPQHSGENVSITFYRVDYLTPELFFVPGGKKNEWVHEGYVSMDDMGNLLTSYIHNHALVPGVLLRYRVAAINIFGVGSYSDGYEVTTPNAPDTAGNGAPDVEEITVNAQRIVITLDENLDSSSVPSAAQFSVNVQGLLFSVDIESVRVTDATVEIILTEAVGASDTVSVSYSPPEVQIQDAVLPITTNALMDLEGNLVARFSGESAVNNTSPETNYPSNSHSSTEVKLTGIDPTDDRAVLVALYNVTDGGNWSDKTNWSSDEPLDTWYGVATNSGGRVTELRLGANALSGGIPAELGELRNLRGLYLNNNQLTGTIPLRQLEALVEPADSALQELALWGNDQLRGMENISDELGKRIDRAALGALYEGNGGPQWEENENWLHATDPFSFSDWYGATTNSDDRISELNLVDNGLRGEIAGALEALADLEVLNLSGNGNLSGPLPQGLTGLSKLAVLHIEETGACAPGDATFQRWLDTIDFLGKSCVGSGMQDDEVAKGNESGCALASDLLTGSASDKPVLNLFLVIFVLIAVGIVKILPWR